MALQLPLERIWEERGARWTEEAGWRIPRDFGDPLAEHASVRQAAGLVDLSSRGTLRLRGRDRASFLQRLLTADLRGVRPPGWTPALLLNRSGKVIADMRVVVLEEAIVLDVAPENPARVGEKLGKVIVSSDVEIRDETMGTACLSLHGPLASGLLERLPIRTAPEPRQVMATALEGVPILILRSAITGEEGFDILAPGGGAAAVWETLTRDGGAAPVGGKALEILRIEAGIPRYGPDFGEETIPLEAGLEEAISLEKGCFLGQEVIARTTHRGGVRRRIQGLIVEGESPPPPNSIVLKGGSEVGWVTSATLSPSLGKVLALAYVRCDRMEPPEGFHVRWNGGSQGATLASLPFYRRDP